jgi:hypothetical protein
MLTRIAEIRFMDYILIFISKKKNKKTNLNP